MGKCEGVYGHPLHKSLFLCSLSRFLPYIGYVTIAMVRHIFPARTLMLILLAQNDFPQLKYALLGGLGLLALIQRE